MTVTIVPDAMPGPAESYLGDAEVAAFAATLVGGDIVPAAVAVADLFQRGIAAETICMELLARAASHLGELWNQDLCSFADVTVGIAVMERLLLNMSGWLWASRVTGLARGSAVLVQTPGEQHSFGLLMLAEFFRNAGWHVRTPRVASLEDVRSLVGERPIDLIGFSLGAEARLGTLCRCVEVARQWSRNPVLAVMVGGPAFVAKPALAARAGADGMAATAADAVRQAAKLVLARRGDVSFRGANL